MNNKACIYPDQLYNFENRFDIYVPIADKVKQVYDELIANEPSTPFPYWAKIWPASIALCRFLNEHTELINGKKVLEIGAGIGLPSFSIAYLCSQLVISDHSTEAVALMQKNIAHLKLQNAQAQCIDWNDFPIELTGDTILLSDINYAPAAFEPLLALIQRFLEDGSTLILSTPQRIMAGPFVIALKKYIQDQSVQTIQDQGQSTDISILVLYK